MDNDVSLLFKFVIFGLFVAMVILKSLYEHFWKPLRGQGGAGSAPPLAQKDTESIRRFLEQIRGETPPPRELTTQVSVEKRPRRERPAKREGGTVSPPPAPEVEKAAPSVHEYLKELSRNDAKAAELNPVPPIRTPWLPGMNASLRDAILAEVILGRPGRRSQRPARARR